MINNLPIVDKYQIEEMIRIAEYREKYNFIEDYNRVTHIMEAEMSEKITMDKLRYLTFLKEIKDEMLCLLNQPWNATERDLDANNRLYTDAHMKTIKGNIESCFAQFALDADNLFKKVHYVHIVSERKWKNSNRLLVEKIIYDIKKLEL
jgi:hypothetical protein